MVKNKALPKICTSKLKTDCVFLPCCWITDGTKVPRASHKELPRVPLQTPRYFLYTTVWQQWDVLIHCMTFKEGSISLSIPALMAQLAWFVHRKKKRQKETVKSTKGDKCSQMEWRAGWPTMWAYATLKIKWTSNFHMHGKVWRIELYYIIMKLCKKALTKRCTLYFLLGWLSTVISLMRKE